jgi:signal transduction histidine kinase/CheY-like chemotaxis protein
MAQLRIRSIRGKILTLIGATILLAQLIGAGLSVWQEAARYAAQKQETLNATAQVLASAAAASVAAGDASGAYAAIKAMGRMEGISYVGIERPDRGILVDVGVGDRLAGDLTIDAGSRPVSAFDLLGARSIEVVVPVVREGTQVGKLHLVADLSDLGPRLYGTLGITGLGGAVALLAALALAFPLQRRITEPLRRLTAIMGRVRQDHEYSATMAVESDDETGVLAEGFNAMIGEIRMRDQALARHLQELEQEVAERTRDYRQAAKEAHSANQAKSEFLATMSHEIRTPMNGILVMAELLTGCELSDKARRHAEVIAKSGQSLLAIINDILDFSKIEAGRLEVERLDVDPADATETVLRLFAERARSKGLDLCARIRLPLGTMVEADPVRLGQVLCNLVNNALKFTEAGHVVAELTQDPADPERVRISVIDSGIGIEAGKLDEIFDAFAQADQTTARRFGGTGLGLAIARRLVGAMGGDLRVTSEPGKGSQFFFTLAKSPQSLRAETAATAKRSGAERKAVICLRGSATPASALLYLEDLGFEAFACEAEGIAEACAQAHLLIATPEALRGKGRPPMPAGGVVLALTGGEQVGEDLVSAGLADALLDHPLSRAELHSIIGKLESGRPLRESEARPKADALPDFAASTVLVVDDSAVNLEVAQEALSRLGVRAVLLDSGRAAVEALRSRSFDLVLMDGSMPDLDGFEATRLIRAIERAEGRSPVPIVALTAHVVGVRADAWIEAGMNDLLTKPYTLAKLAECLARHMGSSAKAAPREEAGLAPESGRPALLNPSVLSDLREMSGGNSLLVERVSRLYREHAPMRLAELRAAIEQAQPKVAASAAHALKSMSLNIGAVAVAEAAAKIEVQANCDDAQLTAASVEELHSLAEQTYALLIADAA